MPLLTRRSSRTRERDSGEHKRRQPRPRGPRVSDGQPPIIHLSDATVVYPGGHVALERLSVEIDRGEFAFVVGPTGCGKSTLIKALIRDVEPAAGSRPGPAPAGRDRDTRDRRVGAAPRAAA